MPEIIIYSKAYCPYCQAAKALLNKKGAAFTEIDVTTDPEGQRAMAKRANGHSTVPQIFIDGRHIGGCDDLHALDAEGGLDPLLKA
ncbi:MAG: glutaredoxin 3 [Rhizobiales bacterium PAR1]|nr:MAG: glutaredoxin 3 [Rhizobiales bacterium PAR1]